MTQYCLDSAFECGHIGGDTHHYLMEVASDAAAVVDGYRHPDDGRSHFSHLLGYGLHMEDAYLRWRSSNMGTPQAAAASACALEAAPRLYSELVGTYAMNMAEGRKRLMDAEVRRGLDARYEMTLTCQIARRSLARASRDLTGWKASDFEALRAQSEAAWRARAASRAIRLSEFMDGEDCGNGSSRARAARSVLREKRKVIRRSTAFLARIVGMETTRMFVSGRAIRIEGRHGIYEMRKLSPLSVSHGGFRALSVYDKADPQLMLCNLCIMTRDVPLLDHIGSMVLHIQAGMEEEILKTGNARNIADAAYEREWLKPHLPAKADPIIVGDPIFPKLTDYQSSYAPKELERLKGVVGRLIYRDVFAEHADLIRAAAPGFGRRRTPGRIINLNEEAEALGGEIELIEDGGIAN